VSGDAVCLLCNRHLASTTAPGFYLHEVAEDCLVRVADPFGVSLDDDYEVKGNEIFPKTETSHLDDGAIELTQFFSTDQAISQVFAEKGLARLGGISSGSGWSNVSMFQKCPYAWKRRYLDRAEPANTLGIVGEPVALAVGSLTHVYLAIYYHRMITPAYPLTVEDVNQRVRELGCDPNIFNEAWRLFTGYRLYYKNEILQPLAVEHDLKDPRTGHSCRYDLIAFIPDESPGILPGTYIVESKTTARFDSNSLEGWSNDGEVLGQVDLWDRLHLDRRYGTLRGVIINLLGKQKVAEYHRTIVSPSAWQIEQHRNDLRRWNGLIQLAKSSDSFPRARNSCIGRFGRCAHFEHCSTGE
jgi:hypothetical protein